MSKHAFTPSSATSSAASAAAGQASSGSYLMQRGQAVARIHLSWWRAVRAEFIKLISLNSTRWMLSMVMLLLPGFSLIGVYSMHHTIENARHAMARQSDITANIPDFKAEIDGQMFWNNIASVMSFVGIIIAIFGIMAITTEYTTSSIQSSLVANPRRMMFLGAKAFAVALLTFVSVLVGIVLSVGADMVLARIMNLPLNLAHMDYGWYMYVVLLGGPVVMTAYAMMCLGIGAALRSTVGAIVTYLGVTNILVGVLQLFAAGIHMQWLSTALLLTPNASVNFFVTGPYLHFTPEEGHLGSMQLTWWSFGIAMGIWAVLVYALGAWLVKRSDIQ